MRRSVRTMFRGYMRSLSLVKHTFRALLLADNIKSPPSRAKRGQT